MQAPTTIHKVETRHSRIRPARSEGNQANQPTSFSLAAHPPPTNTSGTNSTCANLEWQRSTLCLESCGVSSMCRITNEPTLNGDNQLYAWSPCCASSMHKNSTCANLERRQPTLCLESCCVPSTYKNSTCANLERRQPTVYRCCCAAATFVAFDHAQAGTVS